MSDGCRSKEMICWTLCQTVRKIISLVSPPSKVDLSGLGMLQDLEVLYASTQPFYRHPGFFPRGLALCQKLRHLSSPSDELPEFLLRMPSLANLESPRDIPPWYEGRKSRPFKFRFGPPANPQRDEARAAAATELRQPLSLKQAAQRIILLHPEGRHDLSSLPLLLKAELVSAAGGTLGVPPCPSCGRLAFSPRHYNARRPEWLHVCPELRGDRIAAAVTGKGYSKERCFFWSCCGTQCARRMVNKGPVVDVYWLKICP